MNDPIEEIFNGTPDGIDDDELKEMQAAHEMRAADAVEEEEESQDPSSSNQSTEKPKEESKPKAESGTSLCQWKTSSLVKVLSCLVKQH